jgi:GrpB-like predicted nucleotidyltransferase (UPF0157 family)
MVEIISYKTSWPSEFHKIASVLRQRLDNLALRIDHIGSTSVPGLAAKDIIDIQITVAALGAELLAAMTDLGYTRPEGIWRDHPPAGLDQTEYQWEKWFFRIPPGQRPTHTHVRVLGRANQRYPRCSGITCVPIRPPQNPMLN